MGKKEKILIIDDDLLILNIVKTHLVDFNYEVSIADSAKVATDLLKKIAFSVVIVDYMMPKVSGLELAGQIREKYDNIEIVIMTAYPDKDVIDSFCKLDIKHFIFKPFHKEQLLYTVHGALNHHRIENEYKLPQKTDGALSDLIGVSESICHIRAEITTFAKSDVPVILFGETGTGKEVVAKCMHNSSNRKKFHMVSVNCATLNTLTESELFGHCKGAYTGADHASDGYVGIANNGTLFLDEIGELPLDIQAKLLRFLDSGEYYPVGVNSPRKSDMRVICATNSSLTDKVEKYLFREDLYYRLEGATIKLDPLRARLEDIPCLVKHFVEMFSVQYNRKCSISPPAINAFSKYSWPGNVRQLKHTVQMLIQRCNEREISYADVISSMGGFDLEPFESYKEMKEKAVEDFDRYYFSRVITLSNGKLKDALGKSGMHKKNFYEKLKKYDLSLKDNKLS